jgi:signal transduction histidine kinase
LGIGWQKAIEPGDLETTLGTWRQAMHTRTRYEAECRIRRYDGVYHWHWVKADPELDDAGNIIAWLGTCTDIHDRRSFEDQIKEAQKRAESANQAKTQFLANMSHEIRTPLNAIMGFTELLMDPSISLDEKHRSIVIVRRNGHQLLKIVDEILDISRVESGGLEIEKAELHLVDLINEVRALMSVQAEKRGVKLNFEMASRMPAVVFSDSTRLRQILVNIIGNAIKFTREGSVTVRSRFSQLSDGDSYVHLEVQDTGIGIDEAARERIFQPFSQADTSTTRLFGGTGLGLPLARRLARAMGGDVKIQSSQLGVGTTFAISIRVEVPDPCEWITRPQDEDLSLDVVAASDMEARLRGKRILLVEDAEDNQFLITQFLNRTGAILDVASNGEEGVRKALANPYEVVLMDIQMPLIDGYEATTRLRQAGFERPIIALTAHALNEERDRCLSKGCSGHLTKPISRQQLIDSLVHFVG